MIAGSENFALYQERHPRFWGKVAYVPDDCWEWTASRKANGYGQFRAGGHVYLAHRYAYQAIAGPIERGLQLDHLCRNRGCVRPSHLEPVVARMNTRRSPIAPAAINANKTRCLRGHEFSDGNTHYYTHPQTGRTYRRCLTCTRLRARLYRAKRRPADRA